MCACVLFSCFKMNVPRSPCPESLWSKHGRRVKRRSGAFGERRAHSSGEARCGRLGLPARRGLQAVGSRQPAGLGPRPGPRGQRCRHPTALTRGEKGLMLSLNSTKVQSYNIWDFSSNANFYKFFFPFLLFFFIFCFPLIFLLLYRYFKLLLFKILYNYYVCKRGKS